MENLPIDPLTDRLHELGGTSLALDGKCILYAMSREQRVGDNFALLAAQKHAINVGLPLAVIFVLDQNPKSYAQEHYKFMMAGFSELEENLRILNIPFVMIVGEPYEKLKAVILHYKPLAVYVDFNPLREAQELNTKLAKHVQVIEVDSHNIVPVWLASDKQEVGARTLRPKIHRKLHEYLIEPDKPVKHPINWPGNSIMPFASVAKMYAKVISSIPKNDTKIAFKSGEQAAMDALNEFLHERLEGYAAKRNNPVINGLTNMSPYLHFGQISSLRIVLMSNNELAINHALQEDYDRLVEELVVRKELSDNYCYYNDKYDSLIGAPEWAQRTLEKHKNDPREFVYTKEQFEKALTHDLAWNAAQRQLTNSGKIHGYMRMYWAKKVLEWSRTPEEALKTLIYLNDFYSLDGSDPNGYVGILWSIAGLHDRPWGERSVYGTVRCMVYSGLKRKFDILAYQNDHGML